jgi:hypothetical protein
MDGANEEMILSEHMVLPLKDEPISKRDGRYGNIKYAWAGPDPFA